LIDVGDEMCEANQTYMAKDTYFAAPYEVKELEEGQII